MLTTDVVMYTKKKSSSIYSRIEPQNLDNGRTVHIVIVSGEINQESSPVLKDILVDIIQNFCDTSHLVLDLSEVSYLDSTALGVLIGALKHTIEKDNSTFDLVIPNPRIKRIFEITGLDRIIRISSNLVEVEEIISV